MSVVISPDSAEAKERAKWEMFPSVFGPPGRPFQYQEFPKTLFMGGHDASGKRAIVRDITVGSIQEEIAQRERGFHPRQEDAMAAVEKQDLEIATAAAEENFRIRRMGETARREANAVIDTAGEHIPEVPVTPIRRGPGRPRTAETALPSEG